MAKGTMTFSLKGAFEEVGKTIEGLSQSMRSEVNQAVADIAESAYASIVADAQSKLSSTRQDYLDGLQFEELGDGSYIISLDGEWPNALEDGYPSYDLSQRMLNSQSKVTTGSRAGQPWVKTAKDGHKFAHVPIKRGSGASMGSAIKDIKAKNLNNRAQKITSIFKDANNNPLQGKVAQGKGPEGSPLQGLVKYQSTSINSKGKARTESLYILYRTVSENGKPWIHPGFPGIQAFDEAERQIVQNINQIVKAFSGN